MIRISVPKNVKEIISHLEEYGFEAYAVGGCVRDSILERVPDDWDVTTSAKPTEVKALFLHTIDTGIKHGTVTVMMERVGYEVTTYRIDGDYTDGRHPDSITFTSSLYEDLRRRDFTINAMAYSDRSGIVDEFEGMKDLEKKLVRCVGDPYERFGEDALRMLRAVRFAGQLGFEIEENTFQAIQALAPTIKKVSVERIAKELEKLILSTGVEKLKEVYETSLFQWIAPKLDRLFRKNGEKADAALAAMKKAKFEEKKGLLILRFALLLESLGADGAREVLKSLKFDNETLDKVKVLVAAASIPTETSTKEMRKTIHFVKRELMPLLLEMRRAKGRESGEGFYKEVLDDGSATEIKDLHINGNDLMELGIPKGKEIGKVLNALLEKVLDNPDLNTREALIKEVKAFEK